MRIELTEPPTKNILNLIVRTIKANRVIGHIVTSVELSEEQYALLKKEAMVAGYRGGKELMFIRGLLGIEIKEAKCKDTE